MIDRRRFLAAGSMLTLGVGVVMSPLVRVERWFPKKGYVMLDDLTRDAFAQLVDTDFRLRTESGQVDVRLVEVSEQLSASPASGTPDRKWDQFSLIFRGPERPVLAQSIYRFEHHQVGAFDLFIVPVQKTDEGTFYQAIFNRVTGTA